MAQIMFRVRREYFDAIEAGTKTVELRAMSPHWVKRARTLGKSRHPRVGFFVCGSKRHRRHIIGIEENVRAVEILGRPLSPQGAKDLGGEDPRVIVFRLGEVV